MKNKQGFTIIEAVLVIAIAGLLFLAIAIAIPALIRSQRDTDRRRDVNSLITKVQEYQSNNRKALPGIGTATTLFYQAQATTRFQSTITNDWTGFFNNNLPNIYYDSAGNFHNNFEDPNGNLYQFSIVPCATSEVGGSCNDTYYQKDASGSKDQINKFFEAKFPNNYTMLIILNAKCQSSNKVIAAPGNKNLTILYKLETNDTYCTNN